jgi:hypothetical protein
MNIPLTTLLTITTGRLLTTPVSDRDNGIGQLYEALEHITGEAPFTHTLGRFSREAKPYLLKCFPELAPCGVQSSLDSLDKWIKSDRTPQKQEGIRMWLTELKMMFPAIQDAYDVQPMPPGSHVSKNPIEEMHEILNA